MRNSFQIGVKMVETESNCNLPPISETLFIPYVCLPPHAKARPQRGNVAAVSSGEMQNNG
jgi:hypothetical protein